MSTQSHVTQRRIRSTSLIPNDLSRVIVEDMDGAKYHAQMQSIPLQYDEFVFPVMTAFSK
jgi:hypothetical protein